MEKVNYIKKLIAIVIMVIIFVIVASIILRYYVEGEKNMPFQISKIIVISTAGGTQKTETDKRWDMQIFQNNDIYIDIIKNKNYTQEEIIDKIIVNNFVVETQPQKGELKKYKLDKCSKYRRKPNKRTNRIYRSRKNRLKKPKNS